MSAKDLTKHMRSPAFTLDDVLEFIEKNDKMAFREWSQEDIECILITSVENRTFFYSINELGELNGIAICKSNPNMQTMYIIGIVVTEKVAIKNMINMFFMMQYPPYWTFSGRRRGKVKHFNAAQLYKILCRQNYHLSLI